MKRRRRTSARSRVCIVAPCMRTRLARRAATQGEPIMSLSIRHAFFATTIAAASIFACSENGSQGEVRQAQTADDGGDGGGDGGATTDSGTADLSQPQLAVCSDAQAIAIFVALNQE